MAKIDEAAVLARAKELAERDGYPWTLEFGATIPRGKIRVQPYLSDELRHQYIARARALLLEEGGDA
jgi:hypothetical protein